MASDSSRKRLPFEPGKRKGQAEESSAASQTASGSRQASDDREAKSGKREKAKPGRSSRSGKTKENAIPEVVSRRMFKRMLVFSGIPTFAGVATFFVSYFLLVREVVELPSYFVLFATLGCFGLGVLGLSYGALSASWDENRLGHWFGFDEFRVNFGRLTGAWGANSDS
jgi:hypothetical protein